VAHTVRIAGRPFRVRGWISYDDEWVEYLLDDGSWLCVEDEGGLRFSRWRDQVGSHPYVIDDHEFVHGGVRYVRTETYRSRWLAAGVEGLTGPGRVTVSDYAGPDGTLAALEDWGEGPELSLGAWLPAGEVEVEVQR